MKIKTIKHWGKFTKNLEHDLFGMQKQISKIIKNKKQVQNRIFIIYKVRKLFLVIYKKLGTKKKKPLDIIR